MTSPKQSRNFTFQLIQTDPDLLETRSGGGCLALFGLPFFLAGLFVILTSLKVVPVQGGIPWGFGIPFGGIFAAVGAGLMFGRAGLSIDRRQKTVLQWWGLLVPMKRTEYPLDQYVRVTLGRESRSSGKSNVIVYPVKLEGAGEVKALEIQAPQVYEPGRRLAEQLAKFLDRPLTDTSSGPAVIREPGQLDESLRARMRRTHEPADWAEPPSGSRIQVQGEADGKTFALPPPAFGFTNYLQVFMALVFMAWVAQFFWRPLSQLPIPPLLLYLFLGCIGLIFFLGPILSAGRGRLGIGKKPVRVTVSRASLRVEEPGLLRNKTQAIPLDELEELVLPELNPNLVPLRKLADGTTLPLSPRMLAAGQFLAKLIRHPGITARSDRLSLEFGQGLTKEELGFLHAAIKKAIIE